MIKKIESLNIELDKTFKSLENLSSEKLNFKPNPKKWSIGGHLYHLWLTEINIEKYISKKTFYPESLVSMSKATPIKLMFLKFILLIGVKLKAPAIISDPIPDIIDIKDLHKKWISSRASMAVLVKKMDKEIMKKGVLKHPILGRIDMKTTLSFISLHFKHHKKIIHKLEKKL